MSKNSFDNNYKKAVKLLDVKRLPTPPGLFKVGKMPGIARTRTKTKKRKRTKSKRTKTKSKKSKKGGRKIRTRKKGGKGTYKHKGKNLCATSSNNDEKTEFCFKTGQEYVVRIPEASEIKKILEVRKDLEIKKAAQEKKKKEEEAKKIAEEEKRKAEIEKQRKEREAREKAILEKKKAKQQKLEASRKASEERMRKAREAREKAKEDKRKAAEERKRAQEEAKKIADEKERKRKEAEAKAAEQAALKKAEEERKRKEAEAKAEEERKKKEAEAEKKRKEEAAEKKRKEEEAAAKAAAEEKRRKTEEKFRRMRKEAEEKRKKEEAKAKLESKKMPSWFPKSHGTRKCEKSGNWVQDPDKANTRWHPKSMIGIEDGDVDEAIKRCNQFLDSGRKCEYSTASDEYVNKDTNKGYDKFEDCVNSIKMEPGKKRGMQITEMPSSNSTRQRPRRRAPIYQGDSEVINGRKCHLNEDGTFVFDYSVDKPAKWDVLNEGTQEMFTNLRGKKSTELMMSECKTHLKSNKKCMPRGSKGKWKTTDGKQKFNNADECLDKTKNSGGRKTRRRKRKLSKKIGRRKKRTTKRKRFRTKKNKK